MRKLIYIVPLFLAGGIVSSAEKPDLQSGVWVGSIKLPGKDKIATRVLVRTVSNPDKGHQTRITMYVDETPLEFVNLKIRQDTLHFDIDTGTVKQCAIKKQEDGTYAGFCTATDSQDEQDRIDLSLRPPGDTQGGPGKPVDAVTNP